MTAGFSIRSIRHELSGGGRSPSPRTLSLSKKGCFARSLADEDRSRSLSILIELALEAPVLKRAVEGKVEYSRDSSGEGIEREAA
jgi:hypothetical protein